MLSNALRQRMGLFTVDEPTRRVGRLATRDMRPSSRPADLSLTTSDVGPGRKQGIEHVAVTNVQEPVYKLPTYKPPLFAAPVPEEPQSRPHTRGHDVSDINVKSYPTTRERMWQATGGSRPDTATPPRTHAAGGRRPRRRDIMRARHFAPRAAHRAAPRPGRRRHRRAGRRANAAGLGGDEFVMPGHTPQSAPVTARAAAAAAAASSSAAAARPMTMRGRCRFRGGDGGGAVRRWFARRRRRRTGAADGGRADAVASGARPAARSSRGRHRRGRRARIV